MKNEAQNTSSSCVFECPVTYYNPATKKWDAGRFTLNKSYVQFICDYGEDEKFHLCLPLSSITGLEKRKSNFIYPSLVICIGSEKHWFSSFLNRDAVYNLLELFWRESLISKPYKKINPPKIFKSKSKLGRELLEILCESQNTLIGTANALIDQNRQLHEAEEATEDVNADLTKAEEAIKSLSSPLPSLSFTNNEDEKKPPSHRYKVTFSFSNCENKTDWEKGVLVISNSVILLIKEEETLMQVTKDELDALQVLSPWELCITHTFSGVQKPCYFMCPQLSRLLKFVSSMPCYQAKIIYADEDSSAYETASSSSSIVGSTANTPSPSSGSSKLSQNIELKSYKTQDLRSDSLTKDTDSNSEQTQDSMCGLSAQEIQEINSVLSSLQTLAAEVGIEQESQLERINTLMEKMENTDIRIMNTNKSVKKCK